MHDTLDAGSLCVWRGIAELSPTFGNILQIHKPGWAYISVSNTRSLLSWGYLMQLKLGS